MRGTDQGETLGGVREAVAEYVSASDAAAMGEDAAEAARQRGHLHTLLKSMGHVVPLREPEPSNVPQAPAGSSAADTAEPAAVANGVEDLSAGASWLLLGVELLPACSALSHKAAHLLLDCCAMTLEFVTRLSNQILVGCHALL